MTERLVIAIDGPSASGKGTLGKRLAAHFGLPHLDTGLLYRAVGWAAFRTGRAPAEIAAQLRAADLDNPELRGDDAGQQGSKVAADLEVRANLLKFQKEFAARGTGAVLDGRDIGTVIAPNADAKLFVQATPTIRAKRRHSELRAQGSSVSLDKVLTDIRARDQRDTHRTAAPLILANDAALLDTSFLSIESAVQRAIALVELRITKRTGEDSQPEA